MGAKGSYSSAFPFLTRGVSHCGLANYIEKFLKANEEVWKLKYSTMQNYNLQKIFYNLQTQNPSRYHNLITNLKFQHIKISSFKNSQKKNRPLV
jgi:hypothetical protein